MKSRAPEAAGLSHAFVLLDAQRVPLFANAEALRILGHRREPAISGDIAAHLSAALHPVIPAGDIPAEGACSWFVSGRRRYACRVFPLMSVSAPGASYLLMMDRAGTPVAEDSSVVERYGLTNRETELLRYLMTGLTNKEIGERMQISPNTVKAFLKLMMTKMGVSTRAAVVGRAFEGRPQAAAQAAGR
jgi:DNA-binding CsgD family transcriptional regulator